MQGEKKKKKKSGKARHGSCPLTRRTMRVQGGRGAGEQGTATGRVWPPALPGMRALRSLPRRHWEPAGGLAASSLHLLRFSLFFLALLCFALLCSSGHTFAFPSLLSSAVPAPALLCFGSFALSFLAMLCFSSCYFASLSFALLCFSGRALFGFALLCLPSLTLF